MEITTQQNHAYDYSKNVQFLRYEGVSIFSTNFKGNKIGQYLRKSKRNQKSRESFFTTLHSDKLKSKIIEKFCGLLHLKLKVDHEMYQL